MYIACVLTDPFGPIEHFEVKGVTSEFAVDGGEGVAGGHPIDHRPRAKATGILNKWSKSEHKKKICTSSLFFPSLLSPSLPTPLSLPSSPHNYIKICVRISYPCILS